MKASFVTLLLFCFVVSAKAQVDTSLNGGSVFVVDGTVVSKNAVKQTDIYSKDVLKGDKLTELYVEKKLDSVTVIVTKKGALLYYQNKLSSFSREYESYLKSHNNNDDDIQYVVHNDLLEKQESVSYLYKLPSEKIISVTFMERPRKIVTIEIKVGE